MKRFLCLLLIVIGYSVSPVMAQVVIDNTLTSQQLVQDVLVGQGVQVSNITFTGDASQIGYFDASNTVFPIEEGIVISTGNVNEVPGSGTFFASTGQGGLGDPDMTTISGLNTNDAAILQFEFIPTGDSIKFNFVFGSEEYPGFVNSINDAFAFIISGPGFNGPYINNGENIALIPGTNLPVTIDNVNDVTPANAQYYINNENGPANGIVFNGYTVAIEAKAQVTCGETYILRFVIADASDAIYDSGVFLKAKSFSSNAVEVNITTASGSIENGGGWIVEACTPAEIEFIRPVENADTTLAVAIEISGSATNLVDYIGVPDTVHFAVGDTSVTITIEALEDGLLEVGDSIVLTVFSINLCGDTTASSGTIYIYDNNSYLFEAIAPESLILECAQDSVLLVGAAIQGNPVYDFTWSNGAVGDSIWVIPQSDTIFILDVVDACGSTTQPDTTEIFYNVAPDPTVDVSGPITFNCVPETVLLTAAGTDGLLPYTYIWSNGGFGSTNSVSLTSDTIFYVSIVDACGVQGVADTIYITQNPVPIAMLQTSSDVTLSCVYDVATLTAIATGGTPQYSYIWNTGEVTSSITVQPTQTTEYIISVSDNCFSGVVQDTITVFVDPAEPPAITVDDTSVYCPNEQIDISAIISGGEEPYNYVWSTGETSNSITVQPLQTSEYVLTVTDGCSSGSSQDTIEVTVVPYTPPTVVASDTLVQCPEDLVTLYATSEGGIEPYSFLWNDGNSGASNSVAYDTTTNVLVSVTDACGITAEDTSTIEVPELDQLQTAILNGGVDMDTLTICELWLDTMWNVTSGGLPPYTYTWEGILVNGVDVDNDTVIIHVPYELELDSIVSETYTLNVIDVCGEEADDDVQINVISCDIIQPGVFSPNSDFEGTTDYCGSTPQNNEFNLPCLELYPGNIMTIWDRWGKECYSTEDYHLNPWDGGGQSAGVYFYVCEIPGGKDPVKGYFHMTK